MDFGEVLTSAWKIVWKHKVLWIFGILAGCSRGEAGNGGGGGSGYRTHAPSGMNPFPGMQQYATQFANWISTHWWVIFLVFAVVLVLFLIAIFLVTIGRIGLIRGTFRADSGAEHLGFMELWDESLPYFWRVFLLSLLVGLAALVLVFGLLALGFGAAIFTLGIGFLCIIPLLCVLALALWFVGIVIEQAEAAIVIENLGIMEGLERGWAVVKTHVGPVLLMWLILAVIGVAAGIVIALPVLIIVAPTVIAFAAANSQATTSFTYTPLIVGLACCAVYFPLLLVLNGVLTAYIQSAWALTFLRLTRPKPAPAPESTVIQAPNA